MIKYVAIATALLAVGVSSAEAQGRGRGNDRNKGTRGYEKRVPPGHLPPAGQCRVWYDGVPPGQQPPPTSCGEAQRVAARDGGARVIYGDRDGRGDRGRYGDRDDRDSRGQGAGGGILGGIFDRFPVDPRDDGRYPDDAGTDRRRPTDEGRRTGGVAIPRDGRYPSGDTRRPTGRNDLRFGSDAAENGYRDGLLKGREDADDRDDYDPSRHSWYRSADRGYERDYGSPDDYREQYRRAFLEGYNEAYRR